MQRRKITKVRTGMPPKIAREILDEIALRPFARANENDVYGLAGCGLVELEPEVTLVSDTRQKAEYECLVVSRGFVFVVNNGEVAHVLSLDLEAPAR